MTWIANGESGSSVRAKLNSVPNDGAAFVANFAPKINITGSELVTDGGLATDPSLSGWSLGASAVWTSGQIISTYDGNTNTAPAFSIPITTVSGQLYKVEIDQTVNGDVSAFYTDNSSWYFTSNGAAFVFQADFSGDDALWVDFDIETGDATRTVTAISVKACDTPVAALTITHIDGSVNVLGQNSSFVNNVVLGPSALKSNTTGTDNAAFGLNALYSNTIGAENIALGSSTLRFNISGSANIAVGFRALNSNTTGGDNIAHGTDALRFNTTGIENIAIGSSASNTIDGMDNTISIGYTANPTASNTAQIGNDAVVSFRAGAPHTVAELPSAATVLAGAQAFVTDSTVTHAAGVGQAVVGAGANFVPVYSDGANWIIG